MPTVFRNGPYRMYFFSHEPNEPPHINIDREKFSCKFWLSPVSLARNLGFNAKELRNIESVLKENEKQLLEAWYEYFGH